MREYKSVIPCFFVIVLLLFNSNLFPAEKVADLEKSLEKVTGKKGLMYCTSCHFEHTKQNPANPSNTPWKPLKSQRNWATRLTPRVL
jgi:uncharacterized membrane protein